MSSHSPLRPHDTTAPNPTLMLTDPITRSTIFFGVEGVATERADITSLFSGNIHETPVFRGTYNGESVAIKFYSDEFLEQFETEATFFHQLLGQDTADAENFAKYRAAGEVVLCGRGVAEGMVLILAIESGRQLGLVWDVLDMGERGDVEEQLGKAVGVLRSLGVGEVEEGGMENMLWDRESRRLTLLGFACRPPATVDGDAEVLTCSGGVD